MAERLGNLSYINGKGRDVSLARSLQTDSGLQIVTYSTVKRGAVPKKKKWFQCQADHAPPSNAEIKNAWSYTSLLHTS
jgi:hypothetical protein